MDLIETTLRYSYIIIQTSGGHVCENERTNEDNMCTTWYFVFWRWYAFKMKWLLQFVRPKRHKRKNQRKELSSKHIHLPMQWHIHRNCCVRLEWIDARKKRRRFRCTEVFFSSSFFSFHTCFFWVLCIQELTHKKFNLIIFPLRDYQKPFQAKEFRVMRH